MLAKTAARASCLVLLTIASFSLKAQLAANFSVTASSGCAPLIVHFTDSSAGNPTQWKWDLGNGTISYLQNPSVTYFNPGQYTIKLTVKNTGGADSIIKTQFINVYDQPQVAFTGSATVGCYPLPVQFTDESTLTNGSISKWQWDFGDGFSSSLQHPQHVYKTPGNFNVTLRVINSNKCFNTLSKTQYIQIGSGVKAAFSYSNPDNCSFPVTVNFQNLSSGTGTVQYSWLFGDGATSAEINPAHTYTDFGNYTVSLIVSNASGCTDTVTKINSITINKIKAAFTSAETVCKDQSVAFNNTSTPGAVSAQWSFGDGTFSTASNPVKVYNTAGSYQVKLVSNYGSCADSVVQTITVNNKPAADFIAGASISCRRNFPVQFTSQSAGAVSYLWHFGDGAQSATENPTHTFNGDGNFSVMLVATNAGGCSDTILKKDIVTIQQPKVVLTNLPDSGCIPFTKHFTSSISSIDSAVSYLWDFGDGTTSVLAEPVHTYYNTGVYSVTLTETTLGGCTDTVTMKRAIITTTKPVINFTAFPTITCARYKVNFTDLTAPAATKWLWLFGDNTSSAQQNPTHTYNDTGKFTVKLIVWNGGCSDTLTYKDYIQVNGPIGLFSYTLNCKKPHERIFTDKSIGADEWNWNFGDGTFSVEQNPVHTYAAAGIYDVSLQVKNSITGCDFVITKTVQIVDAKANFTADTIVCKGSNVNFITGISPADIAVFKWDFGDSSITNAGDGSPVHVYTKPGNYSVQLIISDAVGCGDTIKKMNCIRVNGPASKFTASVPGSCLNSTVTFNDLSVSDGINPITSFNWDYADGKTELQTAGPFQHSFSAAGNYKVKLTVTDSKGCSDSFSIPTALIISKPVAAFSTAENISCPTKPIAFTSQSTGPGLSYLWAFGDGVSDSIKKPSHKYSSNGSFTVSLAIKDKYGCRDSISKTGIVNIVTPVANFSMSDSLSACPPLIVNVINLSSNGISSAWDFGDGTAAVTNNPSHFYGYPGSYVVTLKATGPGGCSSSFQKPVFIKGPRGTFKYNPIIGCNPVTSNFTASTIEAVSLVWDFNDGTTLGSADTITKHVYAYAGSYIPKIILTDNAGCRVPIIGKDTITVNGITTGFNFSKKLVCDSGTVSFFDSSVSNDLITGYNWVLGDGSNAAQKNPVHQYTVNGTYYPKLIVTSRYGCKDSVTAAVPLKVAASPKIKMMTSANGCAPLTMVANAIVTTADTSALTWKWDFANTHTSTLQNPPAEKYTVSGVYTIALVTTNSSGCTDTVTTRAEAYSIPSLKVVKDTFVCQHTGTTLQATGASTYNWNPSTGLNCSNCPAPVATPDEAINYVVKGTSIHGCTATDTVKVTVKYPFKINFSRQDTLCKGQSKKLFVSGTDTYLWTPATGLDKNTSAAPTAQPDTTTNYLVTGTDDKGCFKDTGHVLIKVFPVPQVNAGGNKTVNIGKTLDLLPSVSPDVTQVLWSPTTGIFRNSYPGISVKPTSNTDYTVVVKNAGGCTAQDKVTVYVICNGANVFIPNTFSPNGDGANDIFYPRGTGLFKIKTLRIFNRWGQTVFEKNSFDANDAAAGWDGSFRGTKLNPDVYVYTIDIICDNNSILVYKGNVALIQ
jgi:gliding motility-associated-like protein